METLLAFFGERRLSEINGELCRQYAAQRSTPQAARRELEDLRAALNHYHREGHVRELIKVWLPDKAAPRERWLTRGEAARLLWTAWRFRETQNGTATIRKPRQHLARFIIVALYAGRRSSAIVEASFERMPGRGHIDLEHGLFLPRARRKDTKKRQPAIRLPQRLLSHLRRWQHGDQRFAVEWHGAPVRRISKAFRELVADAELSPDVTPHTLRHTCATWLMQRGADPWAAAGYLGMSVEMLIRTYGHHHPDHLRGAWSTFDRPGGTPKPKPNRKPVQRLKTKRRAKVARRRK